ncbi:MAG: hypothetical protein AB7F89_24165, partial [Pirellulaceae bacterium]
MPARFRLGITRDFLKPDGTVGFGDIGLHLLGSPAAVDWEFLPHYEEEISPDIADNYDGLLVLKPTVSRRTVTGGLRLCLVARFGVGYDNVDVDARSE